MKFDENNIHTKKELQWLFRATTSIIGAGQSPSNGKLPASMLRKTPMIMNAWLQQCRFPHSNAVYVIEKILERLFIEKKYGNRHVDSVLTVSLYNILIDAWARRSGLGHKKTGLNEGDSNIIAAKRAQDVLELLEQPDDVQNIRADIRSYFLALKAWVRSKDPIALGSMLGILYRMEQSDVFDSDRKMTVRCYNLYLYALANANTNPTSARDQSFIIFDKMKRRNLQPDTNSFNQLIFCLAKVGGNKSAVQAQSLFDEMTHSYVQRNTDTFNGLINCWLKCGSYNQARLKIERLVDHMKDLTFNSNDDLSPDRYTVNMLITAISKSGRKDSIRKSNYILMNMHENFGVTPDSTSFNLVLGCYSRSKDSQAGAKALKLLDLMEERFRNGDHDVKPDAWTYSTVIDSLISPNSDSGKAAEEIVLRMEKLHLNHGGEAPSTPVYNAVIKAYSSRNDLESIYRAQEILSYMQKSFEEGNDRVKPNIVTYNTVLKAYAQSNTTFSSKAESLLRMLEEKNANGEIVIDLVSYTTVISSYARSSEALKARNAERILLRMIDAYNRGNRYLKPSVYAFNACLNACAFTSDPKEKVDAFRVAVSTLVLLQKYCKPDHTTYGTLIRAWSNLFPKEDERRDKIIESVFRQCCKEGQLGQMVLQQLKFAASPELYKKLIGVESTLDVYLSDMPKGWSRNVKERHHK